LNLTLSVDDEIVAAARQRAEALGTSVNQLVRDYLEQLAGKSDPQADADEFERLARNANGNSSNWNSIAKRFTRGCSAPKDGCPTRLEAS
jgi:hypothetical protein